MNTRRTTAMSHSTSDALPQRRTAQKFTLPASMTSPFSVTPKGLKLGEQNVAKIRRGYPIAALKDLSAYLNISPVDLLETLGISRSTAMRRGQQAHLKPHESDKVYQLAKIVSLAEEVFGALKTSHEWLRTNNRALGGEEPVSRLNTAAGADDVIELLRRIGYGIYS